ncbi:MAG TPA: PKD domain-containing protein [Ktedonobacterales bacterium]|nr:PKD domain-containing protein [Ktedonobacterales bacterium]
MRKPLGVTRPDSAPVDALNIGPDQTPDQASRGRRALRRRFGALARSLVVATLLAASLLVALSLSHAPAMSPICACGLGNTVTMVANNAPALAYAPPNDATDAPAGIFALDYVAQKPVNFYEDLSRAPSAPDPNSVKWRWDFGDGSPVSYQVRPTHTYAKPGTYTVVVSVYEPLSGDWGLFDNAIMHVIGSPFTNPPVAHAHALTSSVIGVGGQITFDATGSHAVQGSSLTYNWNFGDNSVATGTKVTHLFKQAGRGFVTLTVTDSRGAKAIAQVAVVIVETAQPAKVTVSSTSAPVGAVFSFDASQTQPPADQPVVVAWDFGDGSPLMTTSAPTVGHAYRKPGHYTVTIGVYGQLGDGGVTTLKVNVVAAAGATGAGASHSGPGWLLIGGALLVLLMLGGGGAFWLSQRKRAAAMRKRQMEIELARARRVNGGQTRRHPPQTGPGGGPRVGTPAGTPGRSAPMRQERPPYPGSRDDNRRR